MKRSVVNIGPYALVELHTCPMSSCAAPAGSPCRTGKGKLAIQYHTARFRLVPALAKTPNVPTPAVRRPASAGIELPHPHTAQDGPGRVRPHRLRARVHRPPAPRHPTRLARQGRRHADLLREDLHPRSHAPELERAVTLARELRASGVRVTLVVPEHKRLGRGIDLATLAEGLKAGDIALEFLTGELQGSHDPGGVVFTVLAALSGMEREYIRDRTIEGHESARKRGKTTGGAQVTDPDMLSIALHLRGQGLSLRDTTSRFPAARGRPHAVSSPL